MNSALVLMVIVTSSTQEMSETLPATIPLQQLVRGFGERFANIEGLTMDVMMDEEILSGALPKLIGAVRKKPEGFALGASQIGFPWLDFTARIDGDRRYLDVVVPNLGKYGIPRSRDPKQTTRSIESWNGSVGMSLRGKSGSILGTQQTPSLSNYVLRYLDHAVTNLDLAEKDHSYLPSSLDLASATVAPVLEMVEGHPCHVIEVPGKDRLWIDVKRGFALVRRERFHEDGSLKQRTVTKGWSEVTRAVWLPTSIVREFFEPGTRTAPKLAARVTLRAKYEKKTFDDSDFVISLAPGTRMLDERRSVTYTVPLPGQRQVERPFVLPNAIAEPNHDVSFGYWIATSFGLSLVALFYARRRARLRSGIGLSS